MTPQQQTLSIATALVTVGVEVITQVFNKLDKLTDISIEAKDKIIKQRVSEGLYTELLKNS